MGRITYCIHGSRFYKQSLNCTASHAELQCHEGLAVISCMHNFFNQKPKFAFPKASNHLDAEPMLFFLMRLLLSPESGAKRGDSGTVLISVAILISGEARGGPLSD